MEDLVRAVCGLALLAAFAASASAKDGDATADSRAKASDEGLTAVEIDRLGSTKLLVAGREFRQIFEPYDSSSLPTFVTSDSVLNAFHVLFEASVVRMERARAERLAGVLRPMWDGLGRAAKKLDLPDDVAADARRRAEVTVGTALRLLGAETPGASKETAALIAAEVEKVVRAEGREFPNWCGAPDDGFPFVDYGRFRPRGFYDRDARLAAYFRATNWLQAIPFRIAKEREVVAAILLAVAGEPSQYESFVSTWREFLGERGDVSLLVRAGTSLRPTAEFVAAYRDAQTTEWSRRNDADRVDAVPAFGAPRALHGIEPTIRVLPATQLPDGLLFDALCPPCDVPSGLFVAAALGDDLARREATRGRADDVAKQIAAACADARLTEGGDVYARYLRCLASLFAAPEPEAPKLFASDAWRAKSTNAALAGWAQFRHTWVLVAREDESYIGIESNVPGFVEPNPTFFARLASVVAASVDLFESAGAFDASLDRSELRALFADYAAFLRAGGGAKTRRELERTDDAALSLEHRGATSVGAIGGPKRWRNFEEAMTRDEVTQALAVADDAVRRLDGTEPLPDKLRDLVRMNATDFRPTWRALERLVLRLEAMAEKQLRGASWNDDETELLRDYGHVLAAAMLYGGNAYESPRDDAPRVASVFADLRDPSKPSYFQVAVARPRALYLLYPWKGGEVLCRGAVMPYREFSRGARLTDSEWAALSSTPDAPSVPEWMASITAPVRVPEKK
jgi:hypothetical protein